MSAFQIKVPATSANLGPGFDSVGVALSLYVTLTCEPADEWFFHVPENDQAYIPSDKENLIYKTALFTANSFGYEAIPPHRVDMVNDVPVARGLGSSSTAVVAGIELANHILDLEMTAFEKLKVACEIEGHPDNVAPAIYGGIMISNYKEDDLDFVRFTDGLEDLTWLAVIPDFHLETEKARQLLPREIPYQEGVQASATANVLVAALATQDWSLAGKMMNRDQWHQPYRKQLISSFDEVKDILQQEDALGLYISGAGPTMIAFYEEFHSERLEKLHSLLPSFSVKALKVDTEGAKTEGLASREPLES